MPRNDGSWSTPPLVICWPGTQIAQAAADVAGQRGSLRKESLEEGRRLLVDFSDALPEPQFLGLNG